MNKDWIIATDHLTRRFGQTAAVDDVSLHVAAGRIYGLLGRNGAGKTCIMKLLLGLVRPTGGDIRLFGQRVRPGQRAVLCRVGCLIEAPAFYPQLSGRENLALLARVRGAISRTAVQRALEAVDLPFESRKPYRQYSLGMKQRLGIANALLNDPELLILDEPTNGLDPIGIAAIRQIFLRLAHERGKTILLSSHQLSEIEQMADDIGILHQGRLLEEDAYQALAQRSGECVRLTVSNAALAAAVLEKQLGLPQEAYIVEDGQRIRITSLAYEPARINAVLVQAGLGVSAIYTERGSLESYFQQITGGEGIA